MANPGQAATESFYEAMPSIGDFNEFSEPSHYQPVPEGWQIVIADIEGSTKAITEGRYKDVNMMGAACITAVLNALQTLEDVPEIPYVFGGDGATLVIPDRTVSIVSKALQDTASHSHARFELKMRIGIVPIDAVRKMGVDVLVAKYRLSDGNHMALFSGGGIEAVDALVKDPVRGTNYRTDLESDGALPDLEGLSCRWSPIDSQNGQMVTLLVTAKDEAEVERAKTYRTVMESIRTALRQDTKELSPTSQKSLKFRWPPRFLETELRATSGEGFVSHLKKGLFILLQSAIQWYLHKFGKSAGGYDAPVYLEELIANTDFRKFDDTLRLVLDCRAGQVERLRECLAGLREKLGIAYGLHLSDAALMTCVVFNLDESEHVHFIDGSDGGFAVAAKQLKSQLAG